MKILVACITCHRYEYLKWSGGIHSNGINPSRIESIRETWKKLLPLGVDFKFFYGRSSEIPKEDEVFLDTGDNYYEVAHKVKSAIRWALDRGYDYFIKCDDDVFLNPLIFRSDMYRYDYYGHVVDQGGYKFTCGFTYLLSKRAMEIIDNTAIENPEYGDSFNHSNMMWAEDKWIGYVLGKNGIFPVHDSWFRVCLCDHCWSDKIIENGHYFSIHVTPKFELMERLYNSLLNSLSNTKDT